MDSLFCITVVEHRILGIIYLPYLVYKKPGQDFYTIVDRITSDILKNAPDKFTELHQKLVKIIEEYDDVEIVKLFSKKKKSASDFYHTIDEDYVANHIRPYVERRLVKCTELLKNTDISIYYKDQQQNIHEEDRIVIEPEPAETIFNFTRENEASKYFLSIKHNNAEIELNDKNGIILTNSPCFLILENSLFSFNDIDGKKLLPFFTKPFIVIPKSSEKKYFKSFVLNSIKLYTVKAKGFSITTKTDDPKTKLCLEADLNFAPVLLLRFTYGHLVYLSENKTEPTVIFDDDGQQFTFTKISRNYDFEQKQKQFLLDQGLKCNKHGHFSPIKQDEESSEKESLVTWLSQHRHEIEKAGIEIIQEFGEKKYSLSQVKLDFSVKKKRDWFDIHATVMIGEFKFSFYGLRKNILSNNREFMLPNGEIAILPIEWFSKYRDLFMLGKQNKDIISIAIHHFSLLHEIETPDKEYLDYFESITATSEMSENRPEGIRAILRPYQQVGYSWMYRLKQNGLGFCLADDMGLGKTLQTLTLLQKIEEEKLNMVEVTEAGEEQNLQLDLFAGNEVRRLTKKQPSLIVMPASLVHNWYNEINKFTPQLKAHIFAGANRVRNVDDFYGWDIVLATYGIVRIEIEMLKKFNFHLVILDESQMIKNPSSKIYRAVTELKSVNRMVLTGTPIENSLSDLWAQLSFLNPGLLGNMNYFKHEFLNPIEKNNSDDKQEKLKNLIQPFILRRTKKEVAKDLPELTEQIMFCDLTEKHNSVYEEEKSKIRNRILESIEQVGIDKSSILILQAITKLRQMANHPRLVMDDYLDDSGKFNEVTRRIENLVREDHKALIFSSFVKHLNIFEEYFKQNNIEYSILTGKTRDREKVVHEFQTDPANKFFLISLKAGGVGLNLTAAEYVFILDPWWNPAAENQAINRAHRIGQENKVFVYRFISNNTIEEKILRIQEQKSRLAEEFINNNNPFKSMSMENIRELFD